MRTRGIIGVFMVVLGLILITLFVGSLIAHFPLLGNPLFAIVGGILLVLGLLFIITELIETWLSKGQAALVDGLQAG